MKLNSPFLALFGAVALVSCSHSAAISEAVSSTVESPWVALDPMAPVAEGDSVISITLDTTSLGKPFLGFGACFNEYGWQSLSMLPDSDRDSIMDELFLPGRGANFNLCRMPLASNDFSLDYYSYDETPGDFELKDFTVEHDDSTLVPFIKEALARNEEMKLWASPWCPPKWMKRNNHYAMIPNYPWWGHENGITPEQVGHEGADMFIADEKHLATYAQYFGKFIDAYRERGIDIFMVMPQNEFNSAQPFPSCCWTSQSLGRFIAALGPVMEERGVQVWLGTLERANVAMVDTIMSNPTAAKFIKGVGFQWAGKGALLEVAEKYPELNLIQTEQECGDGENSAEMLYYSWDLMKFYLRGGVTAYDYWNISLEKGGVSRWGWSQNSLVVVDPETKTFTFTPEYYLMKHFSHYVVPGSRLIKSAEGDTDELVAFRRPDGSIVAVMRNPSGKPLTLELKIPGSSEKENMKISLPAESITTLVIK